MYQVVSVSPEGDAATENVGSAGAALKLGERLVAAGHIEIMVTTPDERAFLYREFVALMRPPE